MLRRAMTTPICSLTRTGTNSRQALCPRSSRRRRLDRAQLAAQLRVEPCVHAGRLGRVDSDRSTTAFVSVPSVLKTSSRAAARISSTDWLRRSLRVRAERQRPARTSKCRRLWRAA
jgi:hypothetical protein